MGGTLLLLFKTLGGSPVTVVPGDSGRLTARVVAAKLPPRVVAARITERRVAARIVET